MTIAKSDDLSGQALNASETVESSWVELRGDFNFIIEPSSTSAPEGSSVHLRVKYGDGVEMLAPDPGSSDNSVVWSTGGRRIEVGNEPEAGVQYRIEVETDADGDGKFDILRLSK